MPVPNTSNKKYAPDIIETSLDVFGKNTVVYAKTRSRTRDMSPKQEYETWKHVNDSLDWEQARALSQCVQDYNLKYKIAEELEDANAQQAAKRWKQVVDSLKKVK